MISKSSVNWILKIKTFFCDSRKLCDLIVCFSFWLKMLKKCFLDCNLEQFFLNNEINIVFSIGILRTDTLMMLECLVFGVLVGYHSKLVILFKTKFRYGYIRSKRILFCLHFCVFLILSFPNGGGRSRYQEILLYHYEPNTYQNKVKYVNRDIHVIKTSKEKQLNKKILNNYKIFLIEIISHLVIVCN